MTYQVSIWKNRKKVDKRIWWI